jgi:methylaspartate ammonia-lyase
MTRIDRVLAVPGTGAYYYEELSPYRTDMPAPGAAIKRGVAETVSVGLVLDDGRIAWGDCVPMVPTGDAGGPSSFRSAEALDSILQVLGPALEGKELAPFRELAMEVDGLIESVQEERPVRVEPDPDKSEAAPDDGVENQSRRALLTAAVRLLSPVMQDEAERRIGAQPPRKAQTEWVTVQQPLHPAVRYGASQALLRAVALARGVTMAEVIAEEWDLPRPDRPVPIHAVSGSERYVNADKMIVRQVASLPDAAIDDIAEQVGEEGLKLSGYVRWLVGRLKELSAEDYQPTIHLDLNGALGRIFEDNLGKVLGQLYSMELAAKPYPLRVEDPFIEGDREAQIEALKTLRHYISFRKMNVQLVADAWADTLEGIEAYLEAEAADMLHIKMPALGSLHHAIDAVLACKAKQVGAFLGGSAGETDLSARVAVHVALASRPDVTVAGPGTGVDEAVSLTQNEMARTLAGIKARHAA